MSKMADQPPIGRKDEVSPLTTGQKWWAAIMLGLLFFVLSSPIMYQLTNKVTSTVGVHASNSPGGPTLTGLFINTVIFILIVRLLMN